MEILKLILLVLSPVIIYAFALVALGIKTKYFKDKCPQCQERGLIRVFWVKAAVLVNGRRAPDSWSYYLCEKCGSRLKSHRGTWSEVGDKEWSANQPGMRV